MHQPSSFDLDEYRRKQTKDHYDRNEEYRRDIARHCDPDIEGARSADRAAIEIGQSIFKTSTLLNGGAIIAIPAIVGMFRIDTDKIITSLLIAGAFFAAGLIFSWLSAMCGFLALANRADRDFSAAAKAKWQINLVYFPPDESNDEGKEKRKMTDNEITKHAKDVKRFHNYFCW